MGEVGVETSPPALLLLLPVKFQRDLNELTDDGEEGDDMGFESCDIILSLFPAFEVVVAVISSIARHWKDEGGPLGVLPAWGQV